MYCTKPPLFRSLVPPIDWGNWIGGDLLSLTLCIYTHRPLTAEVNCTITILCDIFRTTFLSLSLVFCISCSRLEGSAPIVSGINPTHIARNQSWQNLPPPMHHKHVFFFSLLVSGFALYGLNAYLSAASSFSFPLPQSPNPYRPRTHPPRPTINPLHWSHRQNTSFLWAISLIICTIIPIHQVGPSLSPLLLVCFFPPDFCGRHYSPSLSGAT
jgi:hypothetical protein